MKATVKKAQKKTASKSIKKTISAKTKTKASGQKAAAKRTNKSEPVEAHSLFLNTTVDQAHSPGHRKMNMKETAMSPSSESSYQQSHKSTKKPPALKRRIITGAAIGKTGRITEV